MYELDVAITDLILFFELIFFSWFVFRQKINNKLLNSFVILLFLLLSLSSLAGAIFHAFFPLKAESAGGFIVWSITAIIFGLVNTVVWFIDYIFWKRKISKPIIIFSLAYFIIYMYWFFFIDYHFQAISMFYLPPILFLTFIAILRSRKYLLIGLLLSFVALAVQFLRIDLSPQFNFNSLYHSIQAVAFIFIFLGFLKILRSKEF